MILIKDMDMPKKKNGAVLIIYPDGRHGRLIDADELIDDVRRHSESYFADDFAHEWVDKAPTVIPADKDINVPIKEDGET